MIQLLRVLRDSCLGTCYFDMLALITSILLILSASSLAADAIFMTDPALQNTLLLKCKAGLSLYFMSDFKITFGRSLLEYSAVNKPNIALVKTID